MKAVAVGRAQNKADQLPEAWVEERGPPVRRCPAGSWWVMPARLLGKSFFFPNVPNYRQVRVGAAVWLRERLLRL